MSESESQKPMDGQVQREEDCVNVSVGTISLLTVLEEGTLDKDQVSAVSSKNA